MTNISRSRRGKKGGFKYFILFLFILFLVLNYFKWQPFHTFGYWISGPVFKTKEFVLKPFDDVFSYFKSKRILEEKNDELEKEILNLKIDVLSSKVLRLDYQNLIKQKKEGEESIEIAKVVLKPPFSSFDDLILSGQFDDSDIGQKVFYRNIVLGEIVEVKENIAVVKLFSASGNVNTGKLKDGNLYEVSGKGFGQYKMVLPKDIDVSKGDVVVYPDQDIAIYGVINKVFVSQDDLFNDVLFNIPVDFADINFVRIGEPMKFAD